MPFSLPFTMNSANNSQRCRKSYLWITIFYLGSAQPLQKHCN